MPVNAGRIPAAFIASRPRRRWHVIMVNIVVEAECSQCSLPSARNPVSSGNWSRGGGVPGLLAGEAVERVEHGDAVFGGCGGVGADGGEVFRAFHGAHASGYLLSYLGHPDLPLGRVVVETYGEVGGEA